MEYHNSFFLGNGKSKVFFYLTCIIPIVFVFCNNSHGQSGPDEVKMNIKKNEIKMENKMRVDIWSDVMCPFCYIGKRQFEAALEDFPQKDSVEVVWHSYQINTSLTYKPETDFYSYVAELKGQSREWSVLVHESLIETAKNVGLDYQLDKAKITNSFDAHRIIQLAKKYNLTNALEERFFKAYFTEGALMSDHNTLVSLAKETGLDEQEVREVLASDQYADDVIKDAETAVKLGAKGVPYFVVDQKFAISGAQSPEEFTRVLTRAFQAWRSHNPAGETISGTVCTPEGKCN